MCVVLKKERTCRTVVFLLFSIQTLWLFVSTASPHLRGATAAALKASGRLKASSRAG